MMMQIFKKYSNYIIVGVFTLIMTIMGITGLPLSTTELMEKIAIAIIELKQL